MAESDKVFGNLLDNGLVLQWVFKFEHVLNQVITVRIFNQVIDVLDYVVCQLKFLISGSFLETPLHDTTSMFMLSDLNAIVHACIKYELGVLRS